MMIPMGALCGAKADIWGREALFFGAFAVLPVRGVLYTFSDNAYFLVAVQSLDGVASGIFGVRFPLILADVTRGTGRFNVVHGAVTTSAGIRASLSNLIAGWVVELKDNNTAPLFLAGVALDGAVLFAIAMLEVAPYSQKAIAPATGSGYRTLGFVALRNEHHMWSPPCR